MAGNVPPDPVEEVLRQRLQEILRTDGGRELLYHSVLTAMTTQIPLPFLDTAARRAVRSSMFSRISRIHGLPLSTSQALALAADADDGEGAGCVKSCLVGCCLQLLLFPVRRIVRTLQTLRNYQEVVDLATTTFVEGYVLLYLLLHRLWDGAGEAGRLREGITAVIREAGTRPVQGVFRIAFEETREQLVRAAQKLSRKLARSKPEVGALTRRLDEVKREEEDLLAPVVDRVAEAMEQPRNYFETLHEVIRRRFVPGETPPTEAPPLPS